MKTTIDGKHLGCSFSEEVVEYLYDELSLSDRTAFESHLPDCDGCTSELADVSFARLDVYEWHRDEFVEMPTPRIVVPYGEPIRTSWFDAVRSFFASPARVTTAGVAFAAIAIAFGIVFIRSDENLFAANRAVPEIIEDTIPARNEVSDQPEGQKVAQNTESEKDDFRVDPEIKPVKASTTRNLQNSKPKGVRNAPRNTPQPTTAQRKNAPRLDDFEDEDDNTLRLGDLLAEIGTRDD